MKIAILAATLLALQFAPLAHAEPAFISLKSSGDVCVEHSSFKSEDVFTLASQATSAYLKSTCDEGAGAELLSFNVEIKDLGHGCPYGHQFNYVVSGRCSVQ